MITPADLQSAAEAVMRALTRTKIAGDPQACIAALGMCAGGLAVATGVPDAAMRDFNAMARGVIERNGDESRQTDRRG